MKIWEGSVHHINWVHLKEWTLLNVFPDSKVRISEGSLTDTEKFVYYNPSKESNLILSKTMIYVMKYVSYAATNRLCFSNSAFRAHISVTLSCPVMILDSRIPACQFLGSFFAINNLPI